MFDFHNHFTSENAFFYSDVLLPQNIDINNFDSSLCGKSEIGLDKRFEEKLSLEKQGQILKALLCYAKVNDIGVSLHCVKATQLMIDILKEAKLKPYKAVWHNFTLSEEIAKDLFKLKIIISVSPRFKGNLKELYDANPLLVLETDYCQSDKDKYKEILNTHYISCSKQLGISVMELEARCYELKQAFEN